MRRLRAGTKTWGLAAAAIAWLCTCPGKAAAPRCVVVVGTNDLHGAIEPYRQAAQDHPETAVRVGGAIGMSGYLRALRAAYGERFVLVDGGDLFQGTLPSNMSEGRAVIEAYNLLGYRAAAVGNHEFDFGAAAGSTDKLSVLKARMAQANFPFLTLNIFEAGTAQRVRWPNTVPSLVVDAGGIKVGMMGISTVDTPKVTKPDNVSTLRFANPVPLILAEAKTLRQQGAELVVLVAHAGGQCRDTSDPHNVASCATPNAGGELLGILDALPPGTVDVAVGGHTHQFMAHWIGATATLESGARGTFLGHVKACVRPHGGLDVAASTIYPPTHLCLDVWKDGTCRQKKRADLPVRAASFLDHDVEPEPAVVAAMQPYLRAVADLSHKPLGVHLSKPLQYAEVAALTAEAMRRATSSDFGMQNSGGVRASIAAGNMLYEGAFAALPFDNKVVVARLTGAQITAVLRILTSRPVPRATPFVSGLRLRGRGHKLRVETAKGQRLEPDRLYALATSDFIILGGEGVDAIMRQVPQEHLNYTNLLLRDCLITLLQQLYPLPSPTTNR